MDNIPVIESSGNVFKNIGLDNDLINVIVCGRLLGTASDWDVCDDFVLYFYDFNPVDELKIIKTEDLGVDFYNGWLCGYNEYKEIYQIDLIKTIKDLPIMKGRK